jgi:hypothetical protein
MTKFRINRILSLVFFMGGEFVTGAYGPNDGYHLEVDDKSIWVVKGTDRRLTACPPNLIEEWAKRDIVARDFNL